MVLNWSNRWLNGGFMAAVKITTMDNLKGIMLEKKASRSALSKASGLCESAIHRAMNGETIRVSTAELITQTLQERVFHYKSRGPREHYR